MYFILFLTTWLREKKTLKGLKQYTEKITYVSTFCPISKNIPGDFFCWLFKGDGSQVVEFLYGFIVPWPHSFLSYVFYPISILSSIVVSPVGKLDGHYV